MTDLIAKMMTDAQLAQQHIATYNPAEIDNLVRAVGKVIYDNAEELTHDAVNETTMGTPPKIKH